MIVRSDTREFEDQSEGLSVSQAQFSLISSEGESVRSRVPYAKVSHASPAINSPLPFSQGRIWNLVGVFS